MKKSKFNLSHSNSLTADMGLLIPFCVINDVLPNDSFKLSADSFIRCQPMMAPLMHVVRFYMQWWFVPNRIVWHNWEEFITGGEDGTATPTFPTIKITPTTSSLADYMGLPVNGEELEVSALPFRAYAEIWNSRHRDEDLQNMLPISYEDGLDTITSTELKRCSWAKDYFTTARPFTQRGVQINVPVQSFSGDGANINVSGVFTLSTVNPVKVSATTGDRTFYFSSLTIPSSYFSSPIKYSDSNIQISWNSFKFLGNESKYITFKDTLGNTLKFEFDGNSMPSEVEYSFPSGSYVLSIRDVKSTESPVTSTAVTLNNGGSVNVVFTLSNTISSVNIRDLRLSSALQRYQERSLEYGNRYEEFIQREFGIRPRDSRIQRPEYLGGSKSTLQISEVLQTAEGTDTGVGTMRGHGVGGLRQRPIRFRAPEHGTILGIFSIRPDAVYTQGLAKAWTKFSKLDYYIPELANIGMQEVFESELFAKSDNRSKLFGYVPRYEEYRKLPNRISGEFRKLLNYWNMARTFENPPALNSDFITMNPTKRVFAEQTQNAFLCMLRNNVMSYRVVPKRAKNILK